MVFVIFMVPGVGVVASAGCSYFIGIYLKIGYYGYKTSLTRQVISIIREDVPKFRIDDVLNNDPCLISLVL